MRNEKPTAGPVGERTDGRAAYEAPAIRSLGGVHGVTQLTGPGIPGGGGPGGGGSTVIP